MYLFIYSLFNDAFSVTQTIQRWMKGWYVNDDQLNKMWKQAVIAELKALSQHLCEGTEEIH
jgi:hypothetical protein